MSGETRVVYNSYGEAAQAACRWVTNPEVQKMVLYKSTVGPTQDKVVGVGQKAKTAIVYTVRLDFDPNSLDVATGKSIHFNAARVPGQKEGRLAAVVGPSLGITKEAAQKMYTAWLQELQDPGLTAAYLWNSWYIGQHPRRQLALDAVESEDSGVAEEDIEFTESTAVDIAQE